MNIDITAGRCFATSRLFSFFYLMYRIVLYILLLLLTVTSCHWEDTYTIHGNIRCVRATKAYMMELDPMGNPIVVDSVPIRSGEFRFRGHVDYPTMRFIRIGTRAPFDVFVENSKIDITGSLLLPDEIKIEGSYSHDDFNYLSREMKKIQSKQSNVLVHLSNAQKEKNTKEVKRLTAIYNSYPDSLINFTKFYVMNNPKSMGAVYFVCSLSQSYNIKKLEEIVSLFDPSIQNSPYVCYLKEELALHKSLKVGMPAPDFCLPTFLDDTVCLSNYVGKYLFLDFGASWCDKTEYRVSRLKKLFEKYEGGNFDVLSISLDDDRKKWREYVTQLGVLPWKLSCDFRYWSSPVTKYYRVQAIPYGVLITPDGKVALINPNYNTLDYYLKKNIHK